MWVVTEAKMRVSSGTRNSWNDSNESSNDHIPLGRVVTQVKMCNGAVMPAAVRTKAGLMLLMCWYTFRAGYGCSSWAARRDSMKFVRHP